MQESFGLTPIEAMASGLPVIVSDWDGYRGGVRDGQDGFLIPTAMPPAAAGMAIAGANTYNTENYGISLMGAAQSTSVDIGRCAEAGIRTLAEDDAKRRTFGASGKARAAATFDWSHIIKAYEDLWQTLSEKRRAKPRISGVPQNWQAFHPAFPNPWQMFRSFPTDILALNDRMSIADDCGRNRRHPRARYVEPTSSPRISSRRRMRLVNVAEAIRRAGNPRIGDIPRGLSRGGT